MDGKFLKVWGLKRTEQRKRSGMTTATRLVIRYKLLSTFLSVSTAAAFQVAPQPVAGPTLEVREAVVQILDEGGPVSPVDNSAWDFCRH